MGVKDDVVNLVDALPAPGEAATLIAHQDGAA